MTNFEYTMYCIATEARKLDRLFDDPQPGLASWSLMVADAMHRIHALHTTAQTPSIFAKFTLKDAVQEMRKRLPAQVSK